MPGAPALLALLAAGCDKGVEPADSALDPSPYIYEDEPAPEPSLSTAQVEDALQEAIGQLRQATAQPILDGYTAAMRGQEEGCPDYYTNEGNTYWYDYCYAQDGSSFSGYGFIYRYDATPDGSGYLYTGASVYTVATVSNSDGSTFEGSGAAYQVRLDYAEPEGESPPHTVYYSVINGTFSYDGPEVDDTWLRTPLAPDLTVVAYDVPAETSAWWNGHYLAAEGGFTGLEGPAATVIAEGVALFDESLGSSCPLEPSGVISVRDDAGDWYDVLFDGPAEIGADSDPDACDGCGDVFFRGTLLGQACADFSVMLDWEARPW